MPKRLLLLGSGHVHLEVLRRLGIERPAGIECTVVAPDSRHLYSGMVPGFLAGQYDLEAIGIDVAAMCRFAGARRIEARVLSIDPHARMARLEGDQGVGYDVLSVNLGSRPRGALRDDVLAHAWPLKPPEKVARLREALQALAGRRDAKPRRVAVVGAGAGGLELAFAAWHVLGTQPGPREVTVLEARGEILAGYERGFIVRARRAMAQAGIGLRLHSEVERVHAGGIRLANGEALASDLVVWVAGAEAPAGLAGGTLARDDHGFLEVDTALRSVSAPDVFGAGDCVSLVDHRGLPKAGVFAVRQAPVLHANLLAALRGEPLPGRFVPQDRFLSILNTCDGKALVRYRDLHVHARWGWWLKDRIDRRYMDKYRR